MSSKQNNEIRSNPIRNRADWQKARDAALADPGKFHGDIAKREIFWLSQDESTWLKLGADGKWIALDRKTGKTIASTLAGDYKRKWLGGGLRD